MDKSKTPAQVTAIHLLNTSHSSPLNPLNKLYLTKFSNHCDEKSINLPENYINQRVCSNCGVIYIPGITCSIRIRYKKTNKSRNSKKSNHNGKLRERSLQYICLQCNHSEIICNDLLKPTFNKTESPPPFEAKWPPSQAQVQAQSQTKSLHKSAAASRANSQEPGQKSSSAPPALATEVTGAKKRSKKRKETHNLLNMMSKRKEEKEAPKKMSLNLMDFMK